MARRYWIAAFVLAAAALPSSAQRIAFKSGDANLDVTLNSINLQAKADIGNFSAQLSVDFGVEQAQLQSWISVERLEPAEVYLVLELGRIAGKPPVYVIEAYKKNKGKGWGAVARSLGIKPGSPEFKALKGWAAKRSQSFKSKKK